VKSNKTNRVGFKKIKFPFFFKIRYWTVHAWNVSPQRTRKQKLLLGFFLSLQKKNPLGLLFYFIFFCLGKQQSPPPSSLCSIRNFISRCCFTFGSVDCDVEPNLLRTGARAPSVQEEYRRGYYHFTTTTTTKKKKKK
jgi:hypothetical protein